MVWVLCITMILFAKLTMALLRLGGKSKRGEVEKDYRWTWTKG